jgi:hypothetical protein
VPATGLHIPAALHVPLARAFQRFVVARVGVAHHASAGVRRQHADQLLRLLIDRIGSNQLISCYNLELEVEKGVSSWYHYQL